MKKSLLPLKGPAPPSKWPPRKGALEDLLRHHFGHQHFRGNQLEAIQAVLSGRDCFCLMPTGGGKSMCYQIPALAVPGIVLVVSPLIALMENQVIALKQRGIRAEYLSSTQISQVREKIHADLESGKPSLRLLYVTPELIATFGFKSKLKLLHTRRLLSLIAIDEAHCISSWGHDFRPTYRKLSYLKSELPDVPVLALTATAAPKVQKDVIESLGLRNPLVLEVSFNRPNIFYEVRYKDIIDDTYSDLLNLIKSSESACSIIYCLERSTCDDLSAHLKRNGVSCAAYHAGLNNKIRSAVLDDWISSRIQVVVATVAFGMGIDRKDVRFVCHYNIPKSMESFYQESGRAGRDNFPSRSLLYYGLDDRRRMEFILRNAGTKKQESSTLSNALVEKSLEAFTKMVEYCEEPSCRRKIILESFGEKVSASLCRRTCDACKHPGQVSASLQKLRHFSSNNKKCRLAPVFINSSVNFAAIGQESEFWNREDEGNFLDEDISISDDEVDTLNSQIELNISSKAKALERIEFLQHAEEMYYRNKAPKKPASGLSDKKVISEALREVAMQRLLNALKQAQERLEIVINDPEASAISLETECYKKYEKVGKTFYNSQVVSTVRWLSSASCEEVNNRFSTLTTQADVIGRSDSFSIASKMLPRSSDTESVHTQVNQEDIPVISPSDVKFESARFKDYSQREDLPQRPSFSEFIESARFKDYSQREDLPQIPSFSEFIAQKTNDSELNNPQTSDRFSSPARGHKRKTGLDKLYGSSSSSPDKRPKMH